MSRKPINIELRGLQTPRERVWNAILSVGADGAQFDRDTIQDHCSPMVSRTLVEDYTDDLEKGGFIQRVPGTGTREKVLQTALKFTLIKAQGIAPRVSAKGEKVTQGSGTEAMWRAMKVLGTFDHNDIARAATLGSVVVKPQTAKSYVGHLARAGYLITVRPAKPGTPAKHRLDKNTGMHAPAITRMKVVFDRNTGQLATLQTAQEVCDALE